MADLPLKTAIDHRLGRPLPHQQANLTQVHHTAAAPRPPFHPQASCGISHRFQWLSPSVWQVPTRYSPVRHSSAQPKLPVTVRLACVKHATSVQSEPGSNSSVQFQGPVRLHLLPLKNQQHPITLECLSNLSRPAAHLRRQNR